MSETRFLLGLFGEAALLLWGLHMVQSGVLRAFGGDLRRFLSHALGDRLRALTAGVAVTAALQSSTAVGLMAASFTGSGALTLVPALGLMLGAGIGTALVVQVFAFDVGLVIPVLLLAGLVAFRTGQGSRVRDLGRVGIGLGLMLLALQMLVATTAPAQASPAMLSILRLVTRDPVFDLLLAALIAWAAHSSIAIVLVVMSLAASGIVTIEAAFALVLGANLGSAVNPVLETGTSDPAKLRLPLGVLGQRLIACALAIPLLPLIARAAAPLGLEAGPLTGLFHLAFNVVLAVIWLPLLGPFASLLNRLLPEARVGADPNAPRHLDRSVLQTPGIAVANAARETLRMADALEIMLRGVGEVLESGDRRRVAEIGRMDDTLDTLHRAIERYLSDIEPDGATEAERRAITRTLSFATNLEHAGDIVTKSLLDMAGKKIKQRLSLSPDGLAEIEQMVDRLLENLQLAVSIFMSGSTHSAEALLAQKRQFRELEHAAAGAHFERVRRDLPESIETSGMQLDIIRDLKRINSHLTAIAYPLLAAAAE